MNATLANYYVKYCEDRKYTYNMKNYLNGTFEGLRHEREEIAGIKKFTSSFFIILYHTKACFHFLNLIARELT